jgi:hypothetical protein
MVSSFPSSRASHDGSIVSSKGIHDVVVVDDDDDDDDVDVDDVVDDTVVDDTVVDDTSLAAKLFENSLRFVVIS